MPTIKRFTNCKIAIYPDHLPPHFHIEGADFSAMVEIETMVVLKGNARKAREAMAWAAENRDFLRAEWARINERSQSP